mgnify:CR=1 FL=1
MYTVEKEIRWEMGHRLSRHDGKCFNIHGHSYNAAIVFGSDKLDASGMVIDFYHFAKIKEYIDNNWDHALMLNIDDPVRDVLKDAKVTRKLKMWIAEGEPTAENIAKWLCVQSSMLLSNVAPDGVQILSVTVYETATSSATYIPEAE